MPDQLPNIILGGLLYGIFILACIRILVKRLSPEKTVRAEVIHKQTVERFSKYSGNGKQIRYAVTFLVNGRKKSFYVSQLSYNGYRA